MKYLFLFVILGLTDYEKKNDEDNICHVQLNKPFTLACRQNVCVKNEPLMIGFDSLVNESRCPPNVVCIWQGYAKIKLTVKVNEKSYPVYLHTLNNKSYFNADTVIQGYSIKLQNLTYYPPKPEDHKAQLIISKKL